MYFIVRSNIHYLRSFNSFLGAFVKFGRVMISFVLSICLSVHPHGTTRIPLEGFSWNFTVDYFSQICR